MKDILYKIVRIALMVIVLLIGVVELFAGENNDGISIDRVLSTPNSAYFKSSHGDMPSHMKLINHAILNNFILDSIQSTVRVGENYEKRKWFFNYKGTKLSSKVQQYYGETLDMLFGQKTVWEYDDQLNLIKIANYNNPSTDIDSIVELGYTQYIYRDNVLIQEIDRTYSGGGISGTMDEDGNWTYEFHFNFNDNFSYYNYDNNGLLKYYYWNVIYKNNGDSIYSYNWYDYYEDGKLRSQVNSANGLYNSVSKYEYFINDSTSTVVQNLHSFGISPKKPFNIDTLTSSKYQVTQIYTSIYNVLGKDSIYSYMQQIKGEDETEQKIVYHYNLLGQLEGETYYTLEPTKNNGDWFEQVRVSYRYDDSGNLVFYEKSYYDMQFNSWMLMTNHEYFYTQNTAYSVKAIVSENVLVIFPNPVTNYLTVQGLHDVSMSYAILDNFGRQLQGGMLSDTKINVSDLPRGTYILRITNDKLTNVKRFVKQ